MTDKDLKTELATYQRLAPTLIAQGLAGKWIAIVGETQVGIFDDAGVAYSKATQVAGTDGRFLLREIGSPDDVSMPAFALGLLCVRA